jgi:hypothetical protein
MSATDPRDDLAKEADLLKVASAVGVVKERHIELGPIDPRFPDTQPQRGARQRQAGQRTAARRDRSKNSRALDRQLGIPSPYPDVHETYCTGDIWEREPTEAQVRDAANDLVAQGWPKDVVARLLRITPRS